MATHSSILAWRIPEMGKPGGLLSMGLHRVSRGLGGRALLRSAPYQGLPPSPGMPSTSSEKRGDPPLPRPVSGSGSQGLGEEPRVTLNPTAPPAVPTILGLFPGDGKLCTLGKALNMMLMLPLVLPLSL